MFGKFFKKAHDIREDFEDFFADNVLAKLDENKTVDELEKKELLHCLNLPKNNMGKVKQYQKKPKKNWLKVWLIAQGKQTRLYKSNLKKDRGY